MHTGQNRRVDVHCHLDRRVSETFLPVMAQGWGGCLASSRWRVAYHYCWCRRFYVGFVMRRRLLVLGVLSGALLLVSWSAPVDDGGRTVTGYTVSASPEQVSIPSNPPTERGPSRLRERRVRVPRCRLPPPGSGRVRSFCVHVFAASKRQRFWRCLFGLSVHM